MTIKEVKEMYKDKYAEVEVYMPVDKMPNHFSTDNCKDAYSYNDDTEAELYELMDEDTYNGTILANTEVTADFADWFGNKDANILCIMIKKQ